MWSLEVVELVVCHAEFCDCLNRCLQHSYIANGLGGKNGDIIVDLSNFKGIDVNSSSGLAVIGMGNRLGDVALALNAAGRALPHGTCPYVGIGGHSSMSVFLQIGLMVTHDIPQAMVDLASRLGHGALHLTLFNP
jgi:hypothetical protein